MIRHLKRSLSCLVSKNNLYEGHSFNYCEALIKYDNEIKLTPMLKEDTFSNKNVFITGGSTGLGKAMAMNYALLGANVIIASRNIDTIGKSVEDIATASKNSNIYGFELDVRNPDMISDLACTLQKQYIFPDIIINNAAGNILSPTENLSLRAINNVIDIVLNGTINTTMIFSKLMIEEGRRGTFLNISTSYAKTGTAYVVPSSVAKAGCDNLVKSLAAEWGKYKLRFIGLSPGSIYTEGAFSRLDPTGNLKKTLMKKIPVGRLGHPEELANMATYLTSDYASWINGTIIDMDGGELCFNSGQFNSLIHMTENMTENRNPSIYKRGF